MFGDSQFFKSIVLRAYSKNSKKNTKKGDHLIAFNVFTEIKIISRKTS